MKLSSYEVAFFETKLKNEFHCDSGATTKIKDSSKSLCVFFLKIVLGLRSTENVPRLGPLQI